MPEPNYASASKIEVKAKADGRFIVAFDQSFDPGGSLISAQRYFSDGSPQGDKMKLNIGPPGTQSLGGLEYFADGGFVAVYEDTSADGAGYGVRAQLFKSNGDPDGGPITVNAVAAGDQRWPGVVVLDTDEFVVSFIWGGVVYTRRFERDGTPALGRREKQANETGPGAQRRPDAAALANGTAMIVWEAPVTSLEDGEVLGRLFGADGTPIGGEQILNGVTAGAQRDVAVAASTDRFLAAWTTDGQDGSSDGIAVRVFNGAGTAITSDNIINQTTTGYQRVPDVATNGVNNALVVWTGSNPAGDSIADVYARLLDDSGLPVADEVQVNTTTPGLQDGAAVTSLGAALDFAVAWQGPALAQGREVRLRRVNAAGQPQGSDFAVSSSPFIYADQREPALATTSAARLVICFEVLSTVETDGWDLACRVLNAADFSAVTEDFRPHFLTKGTQGNLAVQALAGGGYAVAWDSTFVDTSGAGVQLQVYDAGNQPQGARTMANRTWDFNQRGPALARLPDDLLVVWEAEIQDGDEEGVFYRLLP